MTLNLHFAPFLAKFPLAVDQEGAALDAHELPAVKHFLPDNVELTAQCFIGVGQQVEREFLFFPEFFMRTDAVAGHAYNDCILATKFGMHVAKVLSLRRAAWCGVLWVEVQHDLFPAQCLQLYNLVTRRCTTKIGDDTVQCGSGHSQYP